MTEVKPLQKDDLCRYEKDKNMMSKNEKKWSEKTSKEKLDYVFVIVAIIGFGLGALVNFKVLKRK